MQDRPDALELLRAAQEFCERDLIPALSGRVGFHARVLRNVLGILEREIEGEEQALRAEVARLAQLLHKTEGPAASVSELGERVKKWNAELSEAVRKGELDDRFDEVCAAVYETVCEKLAIANPGYASSET